MQVKKWTHKGVDIYYLYYHLDEFADETKPLLVFSHGFPGDANDFEQQVSHLKSKYSILVPYMHGTYDDTPIEDSRLLGAQISEDLAAVVTHVSPNKNKKIVWVGHDLGCFTVHSAQKRLQDRTIGIVNINGLGLPQYFDRLKRSPMQWLRSVYVLVLQFGFFRRLISQRFPKFFLSIIYRSCGLNTSDEIFKNEKRVMVSIFVYRTLFLNCIKLIGQKIEKVKPPTMFIWGNRDIFLNIPSLDEINKFHEDATVRIVQGGHWVNRSNDEQINRCLDNAIDSFVDFSKQKVDHDKI